METIKGWLTYCHSEESASGRRRRISKNRTADRERFGKREWNIIPSLLGEP